MNTGRWLVMLGALLMLLSSALAWQTVTSSDGSTDNRNGLFMLAPGAIMLVKPLFSKGKPSRRYSWLSIAISLLVIALAAVVLLKVFSPSDMIQFDTGNAVSVSETVPSLGPWVAGLGGVMGILGGLRKVPGGTGSPSATAPR